MTTPPPALPMLPVTELLRQLIQIPSVNPDGDPGTTSTGEDRLARWIADLLAPADFGITLEEIRPGRPNLIARCPGPANRPRILFGPHLDTVGVRGMTTDPFGAALRHGRIWGRGASDTKGPMAAMIHALLANRHLLPKLPVAVDFVAFMGEESGQWGSRDFARNHASQYQFAIVGEPTSLQIVHATKGSLWATLAATGRSAHAAQPQLGDNAILKLARALDFLDRELAPALAAFTHPDLGPSTLNIGTITGGTRPNIVPDQASAQIDIRTVPSLVAHHSALDFLAAFLGRHALPIELQEPGENPPMVVPPDHPWLRRLQSIHPHARLVGAPWFSDAAHLHHHGLPAVCIGPGSINQAHTADEFIDAAELQRGAAFFSTLVQHLAS